MLLNIIQNSTSLETITCDYGDPPWRNKEIKKLKIEKNLAFKSYCCSNRNMFLYIKTFLNNKKVHCIPLLFHENKFMAGFKEKAELFNHFL